jgi:hypothetical protein
MPITAWAISLLALLPARSHPPDKVPQKVGRGFQLGSYEPDHESRRPIARASAFLRMWVESRGRYTEHE